MKSSINIIKYKYSSAFPRTVAGILARYRGHAARSEPSRSDEWERFLCKGGWVSSTET
jgi:hypothetical protein